MNDELIAPVAELGLILLDRDGVLNQLVVDAEHGTVDSPLHESQVEVDPSVPEALAKLTEAGFGVVVVSNQPASAKGKTSRENLESVHSRVLELVQSKGGRILRSYICHHRSEDLCRCRKPATGLLEQAFQDFPQFKTGQSWMVGDGVGDVQAGQKLGVKTVFLGAYKLESERVLEQKKVRPTLWANNLSEFVELVLNQTKQQISEKSGEESPFVKNCCVCGDTKLHYLFSSDDLRVVRCGDCDMLMLNPQPSPQRLKRIYEASSLLQVKGEQEKNRLMASRRAAADYCLSLLLKYRGHHSGRLLEIGSGHGDFLVQSLAKGYQVTGLEYSKQLSDEARKTLGSRATIINGQIDALKGETGVYDVCVLTDVIEHIRDPRIFMEAVHRLIKPGGVLFVVASHLNTWTPITHKNKKVEFKPGRLFYFDESNLQTFLFGCGFRDMILRPGVGAADGMVVMAHPHKKEATRKLSVIVPAFNEEATISSVLDALMTKKIENLDIEVVVVESRSTDKTREIVERYGRYPRVKLIFEDRPRGKGHAIRTGFKHATGDFILIQDADMEYDFEDYDVLLEPLLSGKSAFVLGSRHGGRILKLRKVQEDPFKAFVLNCGHWLFCALVDILYWLPLRDPFTMFKVFRRDCLYGLTFECNRFDFDYELLIKLVRKGYIPVEIPVNYKSRSFAEGKKVSMLRDPWTWLRALFKYRFVRIDPLEEVAKGNRSSHGE